MIERAYNAGALMDNGSLKPSSCFIVPLRSGQSLEIENRVSKVDERKELTTKSLECTHKGKLRDYTIKSRGGRNQMKLGLRRLGSTFC